jgi:glycosyltransferase involved in cell wall biosynthesis
VLDAFAVVKAQRPDATLTLAGSGSEGPKLLEKAEAIGGVTFAGRVEPAAMPALYASHALLLNASVWTTSRCRCSKRSPRACRSSRRPPAASRGW